MYLSNRARKVIGLPIVANEDANALTQQEITTSKSKARLDITAEQIVKEWQQDLRDHPIGAFGFFGHTPPFRDLDFEVLSVANSRRQDAATVPFDLDDDPAPLRVKFCGEGETTISIVQIPASHQVVDISSLRSLISAAREALLASIEESSALNVEVKGEPGFRNFIWRRRDVDPRSVGGD